jgi:clan AA aspartic protease
MSSLFMPNRTDRIVEGERRIYPDEAEGIQMGDVWVDITLTNAGDLSDVRKGYITEDKVRSVKVRALVDTGAVQCAIPEKIANELGLGSLFTDKVTFADGRSEQIPIAEPCLFDILGRKVFEQCFIVGREVLIGQTALEKTDLFVDCKGRKVVGNPAHPDQAILRLF